MLADGHDYFAVGNLAVSPDHRWLAYSTDTTGGERYTMRFVDLAARCRAYSVAGSPDESIEDTSYGVAWANDNATVFYVRVDEAMRPYQLWRHRVGTDPAVDMLVYEEPDDRYYLGRGTDQGRPVHPARPGLQGDLGVPGTARRRPRGASSRSSSPGAREWSTASTTTGATHRQGRAGRFLIVTNDGAEDFRLMEAPDATRAGPLERGDPRRPGVRLDGVDPFAGQLVVYEREGGETRMRVIDAATGASTPLEQPESPSTVWGGANPEYDSTDPALRVHLARHPPFGLRPRPRDGRRRSC